MEKTTQQNDQDTISSYVADLTQIEIEGYELGVKKARNALFWAAGLFFVGEMISLFMTPGLDAITISIVIAIALVEAGIFVALGFWTRKKPYTAIIWGIITFCAFIILGAVATGYSDGASAGVANIFRGIIVKIIILINLIRPLGDAKALETKRELFGKE